MSPPPKKQNQKSGPLEPPRPPGFNRNRLGPGPPGHGLRHGARGAAGAAGLGHLVGGLGQGHLKVQGLVAWLGGLVGDLVFVGLETSSSFLLN